MLLSLWFLYAAALFIAGTCIAWPWWFMPFIRQRFWCESCHHELTVGKKFRASFNAVDNLEGR